MTGGVLTGPGGLVATGGTVVTGGTVTTGGVAPAGGMDVAINGPPPLPHPAIRKTHPSPALLIFMKPVYEDISS